MCQGNSSVTVPRFLQRWLPRGQMVSRLRAVEFAPDSYLMSQVNGYCFAVTQAAPHDHESSDVKWLSAEELDSWLSVVRMMTWLPWSIDQQLQRDAKLAMVDYQVMAMLSESAEQTMRLSSLAEVTNASLSRLSRVVTRLEKRGLVRREIDATDGRFTKAILTEEGLRTLAEAAPAHVAHVRSLVIDVLSPEQLRRLGRDADRIMARIDTSRIN
jgi:DNA-binding MarR family transcriptional regulator